MNILGFQSQVVTDAYRTMVRATWPSTLKVIYPGGLDASLLREWRQRRPDGLLVLRHYFPDEHLDPAKIAAVMRVARAPGLLELDPVVECPINEAHQTSPDEIARLSDYSVAFVEACAEQGLRPAVGVFSEGNPSDLGWWTHFYPALRAARAAGGYLALHEYGIPSLGFEDWHLLRHRRVWEVLPADCRVPILVTESGIDGGIEGRPRTGWRGYMTAPQYGAWLRRYHREIAIAPYVHGSTVFLCGGNTDWTLFDITDEVDLRPPLVENLSMPARWTPQEAPPVAELLGVDVSNWQADIDWPAVAAAGRTFAFIKASEDPLFVDGYFARNWAGAKNAGLARGAYHFARPSASGPAASVTLLQGQLDAVGGLQPGDMIALDIEDERVPWSRNLLQWVAEWLDLAERVFRVRPVIYSGYWYMEPHGLLDPALGKYPLWYASYQDQAPPAPTGWDELTFWQFTAHGHVPGINGDADENRFFGTAADLRALGLQGPAAPTVPTGVLTALDVLWDYVGDDVEKQKTIIAVKVALGLQAA